MRCPRAGSWPVLSVAILYPTALTWLYFVHLTGYDPWLQRGVYSAGKLLQFGLPVLWALAALGTKPAWRLPRPRELAWGAGSGLVVAAAMLLLYAALEPGGLFAGATEQVRAKILDLQLHSVALYAGLGVFYSLIHSLLEELYWRWFVYGGLRCRLAEITAILVSSLGFMAHHVIVLGTYFGWDSPFSYLFSLAVAAGGALWAWLYERNRSLYAPWLSHLLVDAAIFLIGYAMVRSVLT